MKRFEIELEFEVLRQAWETYTEKQREFGKMVNDAMARLVHEAARERMSVKDVAKLSGFSQQRIRTLMKAHGLDPRQNKTLLAEQAAKALAENAELLGIEPREMDLMSPLAYLPMGSQLRAELEASTDRRPKLGPTEEELVTVFQEAWLDADQQGLEGNRTLAGVRAILKAQAEHE